MIGEKLFPLFKGLVKKILDHRQYTTSTSGTDSARYCYSVWLRHLIHAHQQGFSIRDKIVAELGPGDSLGMGLAAIICGAKQYYAMDVYQYWDVQRNLDIFDHLVDLFRQRTPIPGDDEFPKVHPKPIDHSFPFHILPDEYLDEMLNPDRIGKIRQDIMHLGKDDTGCIRHFIPWHRKENLNHGTVDYFFSQAVLEYVDDLKQAYRKFNKWLKPGGIMSHCIDFSAHGLTKTWNAHWMFSPGEWKLAHGNLKIVLNRAPRSHHLQLLEDHGFNVLAIHDLIRGTDYHAGHFHQDYRHLSMEDASTYASFIMSRKEKPLGFE